MTLWIAARPEASESDAKTKLLPKSATQIQVRNHRLELARNVVALLTMALFTFAVFCGTIFVAYVWTRTCHSHQVNFDIPGEKLHGVDFWDVAGEEYVRLEGGLDVNVTMTDGDFITCALVHHKERNIILITLYAVSGLLGLLAFVGLLLYVCGRNKVLQPRTDVGDMDAMQAEDHFDVYPKTREHINYFYDLTILPFTKALLVLMIALFVHYMLWEEQGKAEPKAAYDILFTAAVIFGIMSVSVLLPLCMSLASTLKLLFVSRDVRTDLIKQVHTVIHKGLKDDSGKAFLNVANGGEHITCKQIKKLSTLRYLQMLNWIVLILILLIGVLRISHRSGIIPVHNDTQYTGDHVTRFIYNGTDMLADTDPYKLLTLHSNNTMTARHRIQREKGFQNVFNVFLGISGVLVLVTVVILVWHSNADHLDNYYEKIIGKARSISILNGKGVNYIFWFNGIVMSLLPTALVGAIGNMIFSNTNLHRHEWMAYIMYFLAFIVGLAFLLMLCAGVAFMLGGDSIKQSEKYDAQAGIVSLHSKFYESADSMNTVITAGHSSMLTRRIKSS